MDSLKDHADTLLIIVCQNFVDQPMNDVVLELWEAAQEAQDGLSRYEKQRTLRSLYHWLRADEGDNFEMTALRFYVWQRSTDSEVKLALGNVIRKAWLATEYMKEMVQNG